MTAGVVRRVGTPALCVALALGAAALLLVDGRSPSGLALFVGRFHPLVVHFPIALLLLAALLDVAAATVRPLRPLRRATAFVLLLGAVTAVIAAAAGALLALDGGYDAALLAAHSRLGVGVAVAASIAALLRHEAERRRSDVARRGYGLGYRAALAATVVVLVAAGHRGASLTHGASFLSEHLPAPLASLAILGGGSVSTTSRLPNVTDVDSARVYADLVAPILERRCASCHGEAKAKGGFRLHTVDALFEGGDGGPAIVAGDAEESDLLRRVTLPAGHDDAMPPAGRAPLDVGETELLRWWIANGASTTQRVADVDTIPSAVATQLARIAGPRTPRRTGVYAIEAPPADRAAMDALRREGIGVEPVAADVALLRVSAVNVRSGFDDERLRRLLPVAAQVTWLDLSGTRVSDAGVATLARLPNLTRLSLGNTAVSDAGLRHLAGLRRLEYLNLYGTPVTDAGLDALQALSALRVVYLWGTQVTPEGRAALQAHLPALRVFGGAAPARVARRDSIVGRSSSRR